MPDPQTDRLIELIAKGFLPLLMVAMVLYGGYLLFDRMLTSEQANAAKMQTNMTRMVDGFVKTLEDIRDIRRQEMADRKSINQKLLLLLERGQRGAPELKTKPSAIGGD